MLISMLMDDNTLTELAVGTSLYTIAGSKTSPGFADYRSKTKDTLRSLTLESAGFYSAPECEIIVFQKLKVVLLLRRCCVTVNCEYHPS